MSHTCKQHSSRRSKSFASLSSCAKGAAYRFLAITLWFSVFVVCPFTDPTKERMMGWMECWDKSSADMAIKHKLLHYTQCIKASYSTLSIVSIQAHCDDAELERENGKHANEQFRVTIRQQHQPYRFCEIVIIIIIIIIICEKARDDQKKG